jgi:hypothetical protein
VRPRVFSTGADRTGHLASCTAAACLRHRERSACRYRRDTVHHRHNRRNDLLATDPQLFLYARFLPSIRR